MINDHDMPTWRLITLKKKIGHMCNKYIYKSGIFMNIQKQGKKPMKKKYLYFIYSLNTLRPSQGSKGVCLHHKPSFTRLCNEMTIKRKKQTF